MEKLLHEVNKLCLYSLKKEWIDSIYNSEFLDFDDLPLDYNVAIEEVISIFYKIIKYIDTLLRLKSEENKTWATLSHHIQYKDLLAFVGYNIHNGTKNIFTKEYRDCAILAARLYFKLLSIPGYRAYQIYYSQLFINSLACLSFPKQMCESHNSNTDKLVRDLNSIIEKLQLFVHDLKTIIPGLELDHTDIKFEGILDNLVDITSGAAVSKYNIDRIELAKVSRFIYDIMHFLLCDSNGKPNEAAIQLLFKCLVPKLLAASLDLRSTNNFIRASYVTYSGILLLKYGKAALPGYILLLQHLCYTLDGLEKSEVRQARVTVVTGLMSMLSHKSHKSIVEWIIKLSTTARVPHRQIALELIAKLLDYDPEDTPLRPINQQSHDSNNEQSSDPQTSNAAGAENQTTCNLISTDDESSQDSQLLQQNHEMTEEEQLNSLQKRPLTVSHAALLHAVYVRVNDSSGTLRTRAFDILAQCVASDRPALVKAIKDLNGTGEVTRLMVVSSRGVRDDRALVRRAAVGLVHKLYINNGSITSIPSLSVDITNTSDVPDAGVSTIEEVTSNTSKPTDATTTENEASVLEITNNEQIDCALTATENTDNISNDTNVVKNAANDTSVVNPRVIDKESDLEKSTETTVTTANTVTPTAADGTKTSKNSLDSMFKSPGTNAKTTHGNNDLGILVGLCRDASVIVRSSAITAIADMVTAKPCGIAFDAFLTGPLHQLSDPETKVQELVLSMVQRLLFDHLQKYDPDAVEINQTWKFLEAIVRHKMKRHLEKACALLTKSYNCINHRLVDILSSHLGSKNDTRDLYVLVLLNSVSRHVVYSETDFILDYYYKTMEKMGPGRDVRVLMQTVELLTSWSRYMDEATRSALREHLIKHMTMIDNGCRILSATLAAHLNRSDLRWATEMMQISERRALNGGPVDEWVRAADLSLVAPVSPSIEFMKRLQLAFVSRPPEWTESDLGACVVSAGRLCLRSRLAAGSLAPPLGALLSDMTAPLSARANALHALCDMCVRYTNVVEPLLESVCGCLTPPSEPLLRRVASQCITRLLLGGYLRLHTPLYYRYCALLADDDQQSREPAEYYLSSSMSPDMIQRHFVDCLLHFNSDDTLSISFDGRQLIYDIMLQRMSLVQRLNIQCRLGSEVLERAADTVDEGETIPQPLHDAMLDTITLLCGPRMKLPKKPNNSGDGADVDELQERIVVNIVSHRMTQNVAQVVVPAVLRLYVRLSAGGGQVVTYLVRLATGLLEDYSREIEELIQEDEQLIERIHYFQENIGHQQTFGNSRNLVTTSASPDYETPRKLCRQSNSRIATGKSRSTKRSSDTINGKSRSAKHSSDATPGKSRSTKRPFDSIPGKSRPTKRPSDTTPDPPRAGRSSYLPNPRTLIL